MYKPMKSHPTRFPYAFLVKGRAYYSTHRGLWVHVDRNGKETSWLTLRAMIRQVTPTWDTTNDRYLIFSTDDTSCLAEPCFAVLDLDDESQWYLCTSREEAMKARQAAIDFWLGSGVPVSTPEAASAPKPAAPRPRGVLWGSW